MRRIALLLVAWVLAACGDGSVVRADGELRVEGEALHFPRTFVGERSEAHVKVLYTGRSSVHVTLETEPPFSVPESQELPGAVATEIGVTFEPMEPGVLEGLLRLRAGEQVIELPLVGEGVDTKVCEPSNDCRRVVLDPTMGCVEERLPDGTPCGGACLDRGVCQEGVCVGEPLDCDDGNACTADLCDPDLGCIHDDASHACEAGDDPCAAPSCDPVEGCVLVPVPDGVACGPADCETSRICLAGACQVVRTPDGGACGETSPCQEAGVCQDGTCVQPPKRTLLPRWTRAPAPGRSLHFDGVGDPLGHLYWAECGDGCALVKADLDGRIVYRAQMFDGAVEGRGRLMLVDDAIVSSFRPGALEAFDAESGLKRHYSPLVSELPGVTPSARISISELAGSGATVVALVEAHEGEERIGGWVVSYSLTTGKLRWSLSTVGFLDGLVLGEGGRIFVTVRDAKGEGSGHLLALASDGVELWRKEAEPRPLLATSGSWLLGATGQVLGVTDGKDGYRLPATAPLFSRSALLTPSRGFLFGYPVRSCGDGVTCPSWEAQLLAFDPLGSLLWTSPVSSAEGWERSEALLTDKERVLFAEGGDTSRSCGGSMTLRELESGGVEVMACELPAGGKYIGPTALHAGVWVAFDVCSGSLQAFSLPDRELAGRGWVTAHGGPARQGRPR